MPRDDPERFFFLLQMHIVIAAVVIPGLVAVQPFARPILRSSHHRCISVSCQEQQPAEVLPWDGPAGWQAQRDPATGNVYYVDVVNMVSQWDVPTAPAVPAAPSAVAPAPPPLPPPPQAAFDEGDALLGGMISAEQNPYVVSKSQRMKAKFGDNTDGIMTPAQEAKRVALESSLAADLARFKADPNLNPQREGDSEPTMMQNVINTLGKILTFNFFIIIGFFTWFLTGVAMQFGADNTAIIEAFRSYWDVLIMPLLTTHMTLTFLSAGLERIGGEKEA